MDHNARACAEFDRLSRRQFVGLGGAMLTSLALRPVLGAPPKPNYMPSVGGGVEVNERDALIVIFLRGGADGLSLCVPYAEDQYYLTRPRLSIPRPAPGRADAAIDLDGFFGLHPAMAPLMPVFRNGHLLMASAVGFDDTSRSHFDAQKWMELGRTGDNTLRSGWLARHLQSVGSLDVPIRAASIGAGLTRSVLQAPRTYPFADLRALNLGGNPATLDSRLRLLEDLYAQVQGDLSASGASTVAVIRDLLQIDFDNYNPCCGVQYTPTGFGSALKSVAALLKYRPAIEAVSLDLVGWDTHANQGSQTPDGAMWRLMNELAQNLSSFYFDMSDRGPAYTVVVMSEFGRNIRENSSRGTDHGHGGTMMVMGKGIKGGRVLADWPGLSPANWYEGQDLPVTIDYRDILCEILDRRLDAQTGSVAFPGYVPQYRDIAKIS